jgi:hypothetical protein
MRKFSPDVSENDRLGCWPACMGVNIDYHAGAGAVIGNNNANMWIVVDPHGGITSTRAVNSTQNSP